MNRNASESAVDRLIALASDEKPAPHPPTPVSSVSAASTAERPAATPPSTSTELEPISASSFAEDLRELEQNPMWKALMQFRVLVPYIARLLDVSSANSASPVPTVSPELKQAVTDLQALKIDLQTAQRDLRTAVQDQLLQMKRVEEDTARIRQAAERNATQTAEMAEDVKSVQSTIKIMGFSLGGLVVVAVVLIVILLVRGH